MAITRYAGDRFTIADGETKPTGVLDGADLNRPAQTCPAKVKL